MASKDCKEAEATASGTGSSPVLPVVHHTPMSERQQLALIKKLEKAAKQNEGASSTTSDQASASAAISASTASADSILASPPRAPLQVMTDANNAATSCITSGSSSATESPATPNATSYDRNHGKTNQNNSPAVDRLIKKISKKNTKGETPLHTAAIRGSSRLVKQLLKMGADPNVQDNAEWSPLHEACNRGNLSVVKVLKEFGADLNLMGFGRDSPLHDAARNGHIKVVKYLVRAGVNLNAKNGSGRTPREEAEVTRLRVLDNIDLDKTVSYLIEREESSRGNPLSEVSSESENDDENNDIAKFLGLAKSPVVTQALQTLGLSSPSPRKKRKTCKSATPRKAALSGSAEVTSTLPKVRLTYGQATADGCSEREPKRSNVKDNDCSRSSAAATNSGKVLIETGAVNLGSPAKIMEDHYDRERDSVHTPTKNGFRRVPPLKIVLSSRAVIEDISDRTTANKSQQESGSNNVKDQAKSTALPHGSATSAGKEKSTKTTPTSTNSVNSENYVHPKKRKLKPPPPVAVVRPMQAVPENNSRTTKKDCANNNSTTQIQRNTTGRDSTTQIQRNSNATSVSRDFPGTSGLTSGGSTSSSGSDNQIQTSVSADGVAVALPVKKRQNRWNDMEMYRTMRKQIEQKRKSMFPVCPKPPEGFKDYLMNKKTYLLQDNAQERLSSMPLIQPPPSLKGPLQELFVFQEKDRFKLRTKHMVEKEKLILAVEQEILRVHGRAARALANQTVPYSVCTILRDQDIYNPNEAGSQRTGAGLGGLERPQNNMTDKKDVRSRYNGRLFLSWLQDVDDKWEKIKEQMVLRHHNEAESLNAVQKLDWEWKLSELNEENNTVVDDLYIPMVRVSDEFCLSVQ